MRCVSSKNDKKSATPEHDPILASGKMPTMTRAEAFTLLQVSEGAGEAELKTAWKKLALIHHPDKNGE